MLKHSLSELTNEKTNRYKLVIATAKCARHVTYKANEARENSEKRSEADRFIKDAKSELTADSVNDKAVSVAIDKISSGEYKILDD